MAIINWAGDLIPASADQHQTGSGRGWMRDQRLVS